MNLRGKRVLVMGLGLQGSGRHHLENIVLLFSPGFTSFGCSSTSSIVGISLLPIYKHCRHSYTSMVRIVLFLQ